MKKQAWLWPMVVSLALVSCAQEPRSGPGGGQQGDDPLPGTAQQKCQGNGNCGIDVTITCPASGCKGSVPKRVDVFNDVHQPKMISWKLTGQHQQFRFKDQKIDLNAAVFSCERPSQDRKEIKCKDLFTATGSTEFQYQLHVEKVGGGDLTIDPWIVNR